MTRFGLGRRARRPDDGKHTPRDNRLFRKLIRQARYQARAPLADAAPLLKAAEAATKAVPPAAHARRDSDFLLLICTARGFPGLGSADRYDKAVDLARLATSCEAALDAVWSADDPLRPPRADIFG